MEERNGHTRPRARADNLVVRELPDEVLVYDLERHRAVCLNRTAALVWKHCDGRRDAAGIARHLRGQLPEAMPEELVWLALERLGREHLLCERVKRTTTCV
ncbi:MAG: PqqD family protein [Acidobacteria bacterium]|nr:PqqD family protein [Acidobacteriota bacterium]